MPPFSCSLSTKNKILTKEDGKKENEYRKTVILQPYYRELEEGLGKRQKLQMCVQGTGWTEKHQVIIAMSHEVTEKT